MNLMEPETIRCPFKAGEPPETVVYPCTVCRIAHRRRRKRSWGKHLGCTFELDRRKKRKVRSGASKAPVKTVRRTVKTSQIREKPKPEKANRDKKKQRKKEPPQPPVWDDYDGYYDDVLPLDYGSTRQGLDTAVAQKVIILIIVVLLIVAGCVLMMYFL